MTRKEEREQKAFEAAMQHGFNAPSYEAGAAWADKTMVEKACEWLDKHSWDYLRGDMLADKQMIGDFKKAMEE